MEPSPTIAVLNDDQLYRHLLGQLLAEEGYHVIESTTGADAYPIIRAAQPALVILDVRVGGPDDGWLTLELLRLFGCNKTSVGRHTQKPKPEGLGAVTAASTLVRDPCPTTDTGG